VTGREIYFEKFLGNGIISSRRFRRPAVSVLPYGSYALSAWSWDRRSRFLWRVKIRLGHALGCSDDGNRDEKQKDYNEKQPKYATLRETLHGLSAI